MKKVQVIKSLISLGSYQEFILELLKLSEEKNSSYVCVSNVHMTIEANDSYDFLNIVNEADITTPDGMPLAKAIKFLYGINQDRVAGMDLMPSLMKECENKKKTIFFFGSTDNILGIIKSKAKKEFPNLVFESYSPPFKELNESEKSDIISRINSCNPDFVFVALGCPKQEKWMFEHKGKVKSCMIGFGGAFEVYADVKDRAPKWMQDYSLEWLYRFAQDPKRLWKRYLYTNSKFVLLLLKQLIYQRLFKGR